MKFMFLQIFIDILLHLVNIILIPQYGTVHTNIRACTESVVEVRSHVGTQRRGPINSSEETYW